MAKHLNNNRDSICGDMGRIEQLKLLVKRGLYRPDADTLARALIDHVGTDSIHPEPGKPIWPKQH